MADVTRDNTRTVALAALEEAGAASADGTKLGRAFHRANWVWGVLTFFIVVAGVGYAVRDREDHYQTKEEAAADHAEIERQKAELQAVNATLRGIIDTQKRTLDGVDEVKRILMDRRHR